MMMYSLVLLLHSACTPSETPNGADTETDTDTDTDTDILDCDGLPTAPLHNTLDGLYASEDFAFDDEGHLISHFGNTLFKQEYPPGTVTAFAVTEGGTGGPASMRMLSTGDLVYANVDTATLYRVQPDGATEVIYGGLGYPTGIDIYQDKVFLADLMGVARIDPYSGEITLLIASGVLSSPNGMTFSADYSALYFGTRKGIYHVSVDNEGTPTGTPEMWAESPDNGELLGMGVDYCDNVYALHQGKRLLRYSGAGAEPEVLLELTAGGWMTNLQWGSDLGGWNAQAIYITDRDLNSPAYYEVLVEVPSKAY
jgi:hypothetical protein